MWAPEIAYPTLVLMLFNLCFAIAQAVCFVYACKRWFAGEYLRAIGLICFAIYFFLLIKL